MLQMKLAIWEWVSEAMIKRGSDWILSKRGVFLGLEAGVGTEIIGGTPEIGFKMLELFFGHSVASCKPFDLF